MPWTKIDDNFYSHPKVLQAGAEGVALFICGLSYCARYLTDGFIAEVATSQLYPVNDHKATARHLVAVGLWDKVPEGYQVHDYLEYNPSAEKIKADRKARAKRQAEWRKRNPPGDNQNSNDVSNGSSSGPTDQRPIPIPIPMPVPGPKPKEQQEEPASSSDFIAEAMQAFQNDIGLISSGHQKDDILSYLDELTERGACSWWQGAIDAAVDQNVRKWAYVRGILDNCLREGRPPMRRTSPPGKLQKQVVTVIDPDGQPRQVEATL